MFCYVSISIVRFKMGVFEYAFLESGNLTRAIINQAVTDMADLINSF